MVDLLVHAGASLSASSQALDCGDTALIAALKHNACEVAWHLLTHYPHHLHLHHADREGNTALHLVISLERRRKATTQVLLKLGADFLCENRSGHSPVALAVRRNGAEAMEMFLQHQPDFLFRPQFSWTCMLSNCGRFPHQSKGKQLQVLLRYGADVNQVQADGRTALEGLLACGCIDEAFLLTQRGCRVRDNSVTRSFQRFHSGKARQHSQDTIRKQSTVSVETTGHLHQGQSQREEHHSLQSNQHTSLSAAIFNL
ncbi:putative ankyrin repeat protein RF_0580 [Littorina saxatilis]|uniref:putative ankyrin repeat protein RF_0580 n=1 Tax=Littorina saxatilis TaxID=31220 RepID=UPI0038B4F26D